MQNAIRTDRVAHAYLFAGPRGTGKSYFFSEFSPYATLVSGGQATKATLFYNNARGKVGLVGFWDAVAFDEVAGIKIKDLDAIQIMKDFMANGRFSRGVEVIADASLAFVGNIVGGARKVVDRLHRRPQGGRAQHRGHREVFVVLDAHRP